MAKGYVDHQLQRDFIGLDSGVAVAVIDDVLDADHEYMRQRRAID